MFPLIVVSYHLELVGREFTILSVGCIQIKG